MNLSSVFFADYSFSHDRDVPYRPHSRARDEWLQRFAQSEPYLASVLHGAVSIDKNRAWTITGSERQVNRFVQRFHEFENGLGWRTFMSKASQAYYTTDMGFVGLVDFDEESRLSQINNLSPHQCQLYSPYFHAGFDRPINKIYDMVVQRSTPNGTETMYLNHADKDYIRVASMPNTLAEYNGLGFCAVSRCVEWAQIMKAIYEHDKEQLLAKAPKGLLMLQGVSQSDWETAMSNRQVDLNNTNNDFYGKIKVLASTNETIDAKLIALSQLPMGFDLKTHTDLLMYGYALAFGRDSSEFWPSSHSNFGNSSEIEIGERRANSKGGGNFILDLQEEMQRLLPRSLHFQFSERDTSGDIAEASLEKSHIDAITALYDKGTGLSTRDEARSILAQKGIIPKEWTLPEENTTANDTDPQSRALRDELLDKFRVAEARRLFPQSPIVTFEWPKQKVTVIHDPSTKLHFVGRAVKKSKAAKVSDDLIAKALAEMPSAIKDKLNG